MAVPFNELVRSRDLLRGFVVRDLQVRYKGSALGVFWSLLNPILMMAVYTVVFSVVTKFQSEEPGGYPVFFLTGFLPWTFFATGLLFGAGTLVANAGLIQKVYFPRETLPAAMVIAALINLGISLALFLPFAIADVGVNALALLSLIPVTAALFLFTLGLALLTSVLMVYFRDVEFLLGIALNAWFFLTPIVYSSSIISDDIRPWFDLNPMVPFIDAYREAILRNEVPGIAQMGACAALGIGVVAACYAAFGRLQGRIAEEL